MAYSNTVDALFYSLASQKYSFWNNFKCDKLKEKTVLKGLIKLSNGIKRIEIARMLELTKGMTQKEIEEKTGISQPSYSKIINNQQRLSADNLLKLADAFDVSADWILGRTNEKTAPTVHSSDNEITYGDIFKVLSFLLYQHGIQAIPESFIDIHGNNVTLSNTQSLLMNDKIIGSIISVWGGTVTAPTNVYTTWCEDCIEKYSQIPYFGWDSAIQGAYNHYFGAASVSPESLKDFHDHILDIFKEIRSENDTVK